MSLPRDRHMRRRIRLLRELFGRDLSDAYLSDSRIRADLTAEAAYGTEHFDDSLLTPELFSDLRAWAALTLAAKRLGGFGSASSPPTSTITPAPIHRSPYQQTFGRATVVLVPGGLASSLADYGPINPGLIWVNGSALFSGRFQDLALAGYVSPDQEVDIGDPDVQISPNGPVPMLYDSLLGALRADGWDTRVFGYDWRKHMENYRVAKRLKDCIYQTYEHTGKPVHIITHSQGCLVARLALQQLADQYSPATAKSMVGDVIMLGPANYGTIVAAIAIAGAIQEIPNSKMFEFTAARIQHVLASFTALYLLMPWDDQRAPSLQDDQFDVRLQSFWDNLQPFQIDSHRRAVAFPAEDINTWGETKFDPTSVSTTYFYDQTTLILGSHPFRSTAGGVQIENGELTVNHDYDTRGDGWVPDDLAKLDGVKNTYWAEFTGHIQLAMSGRVINAILNILNGARDIGLPDQPA